MAMTHMHKDIIRHCSVQSMYKKKKNRLVSVKESVLWDKTID